MQTWASPRSPSLGPRQLARWDHVPYTIARTRELLLSWSFPSEKIEAVVAAIRNHQPQDEPIELEAILLRDADILEQLGAVGALRAICKVAAIHVFPTFSSVVSVLEKPSPRCLQNFAWKAPGAWPSRRSRSLKRCWRPSAKKR